MINRKHHFFCRVGLTLVPSDIYEDLLIFIHSLPHFPYRTSVCLFLKKMVGKLCMHVLYQYDVKVIHVGLAVGVFPSFWLPESCV